jgi:AcrR family transcriptional regulator
MVETSVPETRRRQIEAAASALFRERGYAATSVRDIARAVSMQGGSLYAHVASKEDVLWAIVERAAERFDRAATSATADAPSATEALRRLVRAHVEVVTDDLGNAASFLHEWRFLSLDRREAVGERRDRYEARFRAVIRDGMATGEFAPTDERLASTFILSALNGIAAWYRPDGALDPQAIADRYSDLALAGLTRGGPS